MVRVDFIVTKGEGALRERGWLHTEVARLAYQPGRGQAEAFRAAICEPA
jgi:hypothetical protein